MRLLSKCFKRIIEEYFAEECKSLKLFSAYFDVSYFYREVLPNHGVEDCKQLSPSQNNVLRISSRHFGPKLFSLLYNMFPGVEEMVLQVDIDLFEKFINDRKVLSGKFTFM